MKSQSYITETVSFETILQKLNSMLHSFYYLMKYQHRLARDTANAFD